MNTKLPELYIAADVEADGPIPGPYSMISLGLAVVGRAALPHTHHAGEAAREPADIFDAVRRPPRQEASARGNL